MTNEEFERLKDSIREKLSHSESNAAAVDLEKATAAASAARERRKLDRDMNRLERALTKLADAPKETKRRLEERERWNQFKESTERWRAEIREIGARSDAKIKALIEDMQRRNTRLS
ncbi:MAG TPA: hypothetical protein VN476_08940 [Pyrinomonadaceae bacterium]|nr:hypothetical protein [Pyrinomonadaceae bacterium]